MFIGKFGKRPMHFFGTLGTLATVLGGLVMVYLTSLKLFFDEENIDDRPLFFFGILLIIVGVQIFMTGFIAELISRSSPDRNNYKIAKRL
jgi:ATP/ADP translocase